MLDKKQAPRPLILNSISESKYFLISSFFHHITIRQLYHFLSIRISFLDKKELAKNNPHQLPVFLII